MLSLEERHFRSNPGLDAIAVGDLPSEHRASIEWLTGGNVWAVLRSRETGEYSTGVDHETAVIFHSLAAPQSVTQLLTRLPSQRRLRVVKRLVCDQILQIERIDGSFVDGVLAHDELFAKGVPTETSGIVQHLDSLSKAALDHAIALRSRSSVAIVRRLYGSNATPRTRHCDALLSNRDGTANWLRPAAWRTRLSHRYVEHGSSAGETPWLQWVRQGIDPRANTRYKIYVSPTATQLAEVLPIVTGVCCAMDVPAFKVGATLLGVLRPDKLVVYLRDEPELWQVVAELHSALTGFEPHGVPFTAPVDAGGLLSWAIDPAEQAILCPLDQPWSWRTAVAAGLATSIARATGQACDAIVGDFALERLRLDGVEPIGWRPAKDSDLI